MKNKTTLGFKHLTIAFALLGTTALVQAADLAGNWTWVTPGRNGNPDHTNTLNLKVDGATITGKVSAIGRGGKTIDTPIADGKVDGDKVSFIVVHKNKDTYNTNSFIGTIAADQITGKVGFTHDGEAQTHDWTAKRSADTK